MDDRVEIRLLGGPEDTDPRDAGWQAELRDFKLGLMREGVDYSQKAMAFDAVDVLGYPLPVFMAAVSPVAIAAIDGIVILAKAWIEKRQGRGIRYKDGDTYVEVGRVEDLDRLKAFLSDRKRLGED